MGEPRDTEKLRRFRSLPENASREVYFEALHDALEEYYLEDPDNPYQMNGRSSGAARWEKTRRCTAEAVHREGDFLDVGCADGLLLASLVGWCGERGFGITPHGVDFVAGLLPYAQKRFPEYRANFHLANAWSWRPARTYTFVRTNLEYVRANDWHAFLRHQRGWVEPGGRLIVAHYTNGSALPVPAADVLAEMGEHVAGRAEADGVYLAWVDVP